MQVGTHVTSQACSDDGNGTVNLQDLLYAVPRLLEVCDAASKKTLWAVNRTLHHQIADHVTRLYWRPKSGADTSHRDSRALGYFSWPSVVQLTASGFTLTHTSEMQVPCV